VLLHYHTGLEEEIASLRREEAKVLGDLKTAAANGDQASMRVLAKSLLGLRNSMSKLQSNAAHMQSLSATLTVRGRQGPVGQRAVRHAGPHTC
jgi:division protein CdvB (Snf7/Vps24/ESCRT-III family)